MEKFNTLWRWHAEWDKAILKTNKKHPNWQWHQLIAKALKDQMNSDIVICEDPFSSLESLPAGWITYRDLFDRLRNDWIIKIRVNGRILRKILATSLETRYGRDAKHIVIDGFAINDSLSNDEKDTLFFDKIKNDQKYTIATRDKCLKGQRLGKLLENYEIIDQTYLIPTLKNYLLNNITDIDLQLDQMELKML